MVVEDASISILCVRIVRRQEIPFLHQLSCHQRDHCQVDGLHSQDYLAHAHLLCSAMKCTKAIFRSFLEISLA